LDIGTFEKELKLETKPKELVDAKEEIEAAISKMKAIDKPSFIKKLFSKPAKTKEKLEPEAIDSGDIPEIRNRINKIRESLMKFDLEIAKVDYIEIMKIYNSMKPEDQAMVYEEIKEVYFERKSAEQLNS